VILLDTNDLAALGRVSAQTPSSRIGAAAVDDRISAVEDVLTHLAQRELTVVASATSQLLEHEPQAVPRRQLNTTPPLRDKQHPALARSRRRTRNNPPLSTGRRQQTLVLQLR